jgi:hypothetical protein
LIVLVAVCVVVVCALVIVIVPLVYRSMLYPAPSAFPKQVPDGAELVETRAADGVRVRGMLFAGPAAAPIVVHLHGNGETMGHDVWVAEELTRRGLGVLLVEYRGYGLSRGEGVPSETGLYADAAAALDLLASRGVGKDRVVLWGQSLGSGIAAEMALRGRARALVLVSPYTSILEMAKRIAPSFVPVTLVVRDRYDTLSKAPHITVPVLIVHGDADELIPHAMGERLAATFPKAEMYTVKGGHHGDLIAIDAEGVFETVARFARRP